MNSLSATFDISSVNYRNWNAIIIGAGPAGAMAAYQLSKTHSKVLLVDKAVFPRYKVCGCCLNLAALDALQYAGLESIPLRVNAIPLTNIRLLDENASANIALSGGFSLSRDRFDSELIRAAISSGVDFLPAHSASVQNLASDFASVHISSVEGAHFELLSKVVIVADGLSGHSLDRLPQFAVDVQSSSRFGAGTVLAEAPVGIERGRIYMCCHENAYVGLVVLEDGRLDVAAAFDRNYSREHGGPALAAEKVLRSVGLELPTSLTKLHWMGTDSLTRTRRVLASTRLFVIGDSCGYAEPFTGEGMAWALWSAIANSRFAEKAIVEWNENLSLEWQQTYSQLFGHRHSRSSFIASLLRHTPIRRTAVAMLSTFPRIADPLLSRISGHSLRTAYLREIAKAS